MFKPVSEFVAGDRVWFEGRERVVERIVRATTWKVKGYRAHTGKDGRTMDIPELDFDSPIPDNAFEVYWEFEFLPGNYGVQALDNISYVKDHREFHIIEYA